MSKQAFLTYSIPSACLELYEEGSKKKILGPLLVSFFPFSDSETWCGMM